MKRKTLIVIAGVGLVTVAAGLLVWRAKAASPNDNQNNDRRTEVVRRGSFVVKIRETGILEPLVKVNVKSNVEGEIRRMFVREGDHVEAGALLIQLDDEQIKEEKNQSQANMNSARAELERAQRNVELTRIRQQSTMDSAQDSVKIAEASLEAAQKGTIQQITSAELEISSTKTALEQDLIALSQAKIAQRQSDIALSTATSQLEAAQVNLQNAEAELKRTEELFEKKFVSRSAYENAQAAYANANSSHDRASKDVASQKETINSQVEGIDSREKAIQNRRNVLAFQQTNLGTLKETRVAVERQSQLQLQTAQTSLKQLQDSFDGELKNSQSSLAVANANFVRANSALNNAEERLRWTSVTAPMSGTVIALVVEEGEIVQSGRSAFSSGPAIMTIADLSQMVINTYINEVDIPKIQVDQAVVITTDAYRDKKFAGRVKEISPQALPRDNVTKFEVVVEVLGSPEELRPGMNVDADIVVANQVDVVQLPIDTLIEKTKLIVTLTVAAGREAISQNARVDLETRSGKRDGGRVSNMDANTVTVIVDDDAPKGLRVGDQELTIVVKSGDDKKKDDKKNEKKIENVPAKVVSERTQLVMLPDANAKSDEKKPGFFARFSGGKKDNAPKGNESIIRIGLRNDTAYEILHGLTIGQEVMIPDLRQLVSGGSGGNGGK
ncbi:MAG: efflux RND transporter periplasmic adaptor subunit [Candidatus Poribacteria bacterium]|nr:efflux RND transporter periplasmic adaptor subunit [Candidatus Poribacteria bacterium]